MLKKSLLLLILLFGFIINSYSYAVETTDKQKAAIIKSVGNMSTEQKTAIMKAYESSDSVNNPMYNALSEDKAARDKAATDKAATDKAATDKHNKDCLTGDKQGQCIDKANFTIDVNTISPGMPIHKGSTSETINFALGTIIQKLMIGLGSLSLLIMTVGGGYIVLHNGQDELLNKGKSIFMSGIYAMLVALSSYYLIVIVRYVLYA